MNEKMSKDVVKIVFSTETRKTYRKKKKRFVDAERLRNDID